MRRPSFQFYPADWAGNSNLRRCTHEEKGIWVDVMCLLHDQEEYGIARWPLKEIAQAVGVTLTKINGLVRKGILKGADDGDTCEPYTFEPRSGRKVGPMVTLIAEQKGPLWYSSRMVLDEYKRMVRGGQEVTLDPSPKGGLGEGLDDAPKQPPKATPDLSPSRAGTSSSSSSSSTDKDKTPPNPPAGGESSPKQKRERKERIQLKTFIERCTQAGEKPISEYRPLQEYVDATGLPWDYVQICWDVFKREFLSPGQHATRQQADWRRHFLNYVEKGYYRLWYAKQDGEGLAYALTTQGLQAQASLKEAA